MLFKDVVGQSAIKEMMIESVKTDRISHAQLFFEGKGFGALPLVIAYARYIFCKDKQEQDSCGICPSCLKINNLAHPDLHFSFPIQLSAKGNTADYYLEEWKELIKESNYFTEEDWYKKTGNENKKGVIGKDESQNILKKLQLKSFEGNYKVVILFGAERMNISAANKLLKLIEEPPARTLFLLTTTNLEFILPTIRSRTQITRLDKPKTDEVVNYLAKEAIDQAKALEIAHYVDGNIAEAIQLSHGEDPTAEYFTLFVEWMRICFSRDVAKALELSVSIAALGREKQKAYIVFCLGIVQKCLSGNFLPDDKVKISPSQQAFMNKFMPFINPSNVFKLHKHLTDAHNHIDRNANAKILFLDLSFKLFGLIKK